MSFSQRIGKKSIRTILQKDSIDSVLKNKLWNVFYEEFYSFFDNDYHYDSLELFSKDLHTNFLNKRTNHYIDPEETIDDDMQNWFFKEAEWFEIYDLVDKVCDYIYYWNNKITQGNQSNFIESCNNILKTELSAYRILNYQVTSITDEVEIESIEKALFNDDKFKGVKTHLNSALDYLSDRQNPDFRNSIKESISAVETICKIITGESTLGKSIKKLESSGILIHSHLKTAFEKLYAYTNDSKTGIRHAMIKDNYVPTFDEAKFMLVSCSAFINYLKSKL